MIHKQIFSITTLLLIACLFLLFTSCNFDIGFDGSSLDDRIQEDSITINTVIGEDSTIAKIWIDTKHENITHQIDESDLKVMPFYELPEIQNSEVITDLEAIENFKTEPDIFINVFPELPEDAIGYELGVAAQNLPKNTKLMFRDMKASSKWVSIKNETPAFVTVQSTFAGCDTLEFYPTAIGEPNGDAVNIPANGVYAFEMLSQPLKVNQLQILLTEANNSGQLKISFALSGNCDPDEGCYNTYRVYGSCTSFQPKQILPPVALENVSKRAATDLKKSTLKLTSLYLLHKKELQHLFNHNTIVQTATTQFLEDHKIALTNMFMSENYLLKEEQINAAEELLYTIEQQTNDNELQQTIVKLRNELKQIDNQTLKQALEHANLNIQ